MLGDKLLASNLIMGRNIDVQAQKERALRQGAHPDWLGRIEEITGVMGLWDSAVPARPWPFASTSMRWRSKRARMSCILPARRVALAQCRLDARLRP